MMPFHGVLLQWCLAALLGSAPAFAALAQGWPAKPVRVLSSAAPGGAVDDLARTVSDEFSRSFARPFVVDTRVGANGDVAAAQLLAAPADGYTVLVSQHGPFVTNMFLRKQPFDHATAFAPITVLGAGYLVLVVHPSVPAGNLAELLAWLRTSGGRVNYGSSGIGSSAHFAMELLMREAGLQATHVPYKGGTQATLDLLSGNVSMMFDTANHALVNIRAGKMRGIAVGTSGRLKQAPDLPAVAETVPGFAASPWYPLTARAGMPPEVIERLATEWGRVVARAEIQERFSRIGVELITMTPSVTREYFRSEFGKWGRISRASGARNE